VASGPGTGTVVRTTGQQGGPALVRAPGEQPTRVGPGADLTEREAKDGTARPFLSSEQETNRTRLSAALRPVCQTLESAWFPGPN
jgi:hypothetical protein